MKPCVVDASVVAAAFFQEEFADEARTLLVSGCQLRTPDLIYAEVANAIWKRQRRGEINEEEAGQLLADFLSLPLLVTPSNKLIGPALPLAIQTGCTVYDCLYLALAVDQACPLITGDRRLVNALARTMLADHVRWIGHRK